MMQVTPFVNLILKDKRGKEMCLPGPLLLSSLIFDESNQNRALSRSYGLPAQIAKGMGKMDIIYVLTPFTPRLVNLD